MYGIVKGLLQLPCCALQTPPIRFKLNKKNMYDKLKFEFTEENLCRAMTVLDSFEKKEIRGALVPLLDLAQRQYGWLPITAITTVAKMVKIAPIEAWKVANFYDMFQLRPVGKFHLTVCTSTPCYLRGSDVVLNVCQNILQLKDGETSRDMQFTLTAGCCQGACINAPILMVNDSIYEDLSVSALTNILCSLKKDIVPPAGPCSERFSSEPELGLTTLTNEPPPAGYGMQKLSKPGKKC